MKLRMRIIAAALMTALCLSGCVPQASLPETPAVLPTFDPSVVPPAPENCDQAAYQEQAVLWYPNESGSRLIYEEYTVSGENRAQLCSLLLQAMLHKGTGRFPGSAQLNGVEYMGGGLAVAEWTIDPKADEKAIYALLVCCANTLGSLGVEAVSFQINGRAARLQGWPLGALMPADSDINSLWAKLTLEGEQDECQRNALIFRATADGSYIVPQLIQVHLQRDREMDSLLEALRSQPHLPGMNAAFPEDQRALLNAPVWAGEGMVNLHFDANVLAMLEAEGILPWQMYAATACTCLAFLGQVEGVRIYVSNAQVVRMEKDLSFEDGVMRWSDFVSVRAQTASVYLSNGLGSLTAQTRFFIDGKACDPHTLLDMVMAGPAEWEKDVLGVAPDPLPEGWLLGVTLEGREARVNLSGRFQAACSQMSPAREREVVYAMVNTLCQLRGVDMVRFYVEGEAREVFVSEISFLSPLRENQVMVAPQ